MLMLLVKLWEIIKHTNIW